MLTSAMRAHTGDAARGLLACLLACLLGWVSPTAQASILAFNENLEREFRMFREAPESQRNMEDQAGEYFV